MKKLYVIGMAIMSSLCASAAAGDWITVADFDTTTPAFELFKGTNGTAEVVVLPTEDNANNNALKYINGGYSAGVQLKVTLPEGKTIADYKALKLDVYNYNTTYKTLEVYADGNNIYSVNNIVGGDKTQGTWVTSEHELEVAGTGNEFLLGLYFNSSSAAEYAFDNIQLQEKGEPVVPGTYDETKNGSVAGGWLMVQDYQTKAPGDIAAIWGRYGSAKGTGIIAVDEKSSTNLAAEFTGGDYNTYMEVSVKLPEGKTLKDYKTVAFDLYRFSDDDNYKKMLVWAGSELLYEDGSYVEQAPGETWTTKTYEIPESTEVEGSFLLHFGISSDKAHYAVDNIRLQEKGEPVVPGTYDETKNGTVADGWLMVQDYQTKTPGDNSSLWGRYGSAVGTGNIAEDAKNAANLVAEYTGGDYNTYMEVSVNLPEGKTLKDYKTVAFDLYRYSDDDNYKKMLVWAGSELLYEDGSYVEQAPGETWTAKTYEIPESTEVEGSFLLHFGISSDKAHYAVDNIRLEEREVQAVPEIVDFTHNGVDRKAKVASLEYVLHVANHNDGAVYSVALTFTPTDASKDTVVSEANEEHTVIIDAPAAAVARVAAVTKLSGKVGVDNLTPDTEYNVAVSYGLKGAEAKSSSLGTIKTLTTGIEDIAIDDAASAEYFNLQGVRVAQPEAGQIYIVRRGGKATKVLVK